jgi:hypothetical protein
MRGFVPPTAERHRHQVECYLCGTWLDVRTNGSGAKERRQRYMTHLTACHSDLGDRGRSPLADAMLRHERAVAL